jgi:hypothetical protein
VPVHTGNADGINKPPIVVGIKQTNNDIYAAILMEVFA